MKLILDTSTNKMQIIIAKSRKDFVFSNNTMDKHQKHLLPALEQLLEQNDLKLSNIDEYALVVGPGSFTGIRLSVATIKACGYFFDKPVLPINMLELLSFVVSKRQSSSNFVVAIKCTSSRVYLGLMQEKKFTMMTLTNTQAKQLAEENNLQSSIYGLDMDDLEGLRINTISLSAEDYVEYVFSRGPGEYVTSNQIEPLYMSLSQAEEELLKKQSSQK